MTSTKVTQYAVARGDAIVGGLHGDVDSAKRDLAYFEDKTRELGLEPDIHLATVETTTTVGKPKPYREPEPTVVDDGSIDD
jgi:hypothetical protein